MSSRQRSQARKTTARPTKRVPPSAHKRLRKKRGDAGTIRLKKRDRLALSWIGQQYGCCLDHLQWVLGRSPGRGATHKNWISQSSVRDVVKRWVQEGWVRAKSLQVDMPFWVWLTYKGLRKLGLPYTYRDLSAAAVDDLEHLYAINAIRLDIEAGAPAIHWMSERDLLLGQVRIKGNVFLHRPDGVVVYPDGCLLAIEAELSGKKPFELAEILLELLRGEDYLHAREDVGGPMARILSRGDRSQYHEIWYYAPKTIRKHIRRGLSTLLADGVITEEEAERLYVLWYPLARTDDDRAQEEQEDDEVLGLDGERPNDEERPQTAGEGRER